MEETKFDTALVLGLGRSGRAAASLLLNEGVRVTGIDGTTNAEMEAVAVEMAARGADIRLDAVSVPDDSFDLCVVSPGVPPDSEWIASMRARHIPIVSELELGASRCSCPLLAVTGTNGKSTFAKLCGDILSAAAVPSIIAGNYGYPLCDAVSDGDKWAWIVVEVSSFQLEYVSTFRPKVAVLLNVQPDHLDRHGTLSHYRALKARLFSRQGEGDIAVVPCGEIESMVALSGGGPHWLTFGQSARADYRYRSGSIEGVEIEGGRISLEGSVFDNAILGQSAAAAVAALRHCGISTGSLADGFRVFEPLAHRMQPIAFTRGVRFIDDSKATNLAALRAGLEMAGDRVHLIAGGRLKEKDVESVKEVLVSCAKAVYVIGESSQIMENAWSGSVPCHGCGTLEFAVRKACREAVEGDVVLLSPGCASFDQFQNYEDRGNQFCRLVHLCIASQEAGEGESG
jgi:UDP-N-acetylmuramoylalanine--D-glutamate ligase